jgi:hypothetical protein
VDTLVWIVRAVMVIIGLPMLVMAVPIAYIFGLYLAHPLLLTYGTPANAYCVAVHETPRRNGVTRSATLRYLDIAGETRKFDVPLSADVKNALERERPVPMHYVSGWPSTAAVDEYDPVAYRIALAATVLGFGLCVLSWRRLSV